MSGDIDEVHKVMTAPARFKSGTLSERLTVSRNTSPYRNADDQAADTFLTQGLKNGP